MCCSLHLILNWTKIEQDFLLKLYVVLIFILFYSKTRTHKILLSHIFKCIKSKYHKHMKLTRQCLKIFFLQKNNNIHFGIVIMEQEKKKIYYWIILWVKMLCFRNMSHKIMLKNTLLCVDSYYLLKFQIVITKI